MLHKGGIRAELIRGFALQTAAALASAFASILCFEGRRPALGSLLAAALCAVPIALALARVLSRRWARPLLRLAEAARRMAGGEYGAGPRAEGQGEIAHLAEAFEDMRRKTEAYIHRLEALVAEKARQIGDLLENVDQGLFTFNLDLTVNPDHSARACSVLRMESLEGKTLADILRMTPEQAEAFLHWIEVVGREHARWRWAKLARLAPVREIALPGGNGTQCLIHIEYRKILDADGRVKIMALAQDVTEKRALERRLNEEKARHESKVKIILGVAGHAEEAVAEFLKDASRRLDSMLEALLSADADWKRRAFFDCHTLKGNAGGFGFDALVQAAQNLETHLERLAGEPDDAFRIAIQESLRVMDEERCKIGEVYRKLYGSLEKPPIRMDPDKVDRVRGLAEKVSQAGDSGDLRELVEACRTLRHRSLASLSLKYQELLDRVAQKLGKEAEFVVLAPDAELDPALILRVDEVLIHLLRNALAHGIEAPEIRARRGKGMGRIELSYSRIPGGHAFSVRDDGNGIDGEALAEKAVAAGLLAPHEAARLGPKEKVGLIFEAGLSTASAVDSISGRGQGMAIAQERMRAMEGELAVETWPGAGTRFTLSFPDPLPEKAALAESPARRMPITA